MATPLSGIRVARSFIGFDGGTTEQETELDFDLGVREGIEITTIVGSLATVTKAPAAAFDGMKQTLHLDNGALFQPNDLATDADQFDTDSEIVFEQDFSVLFLNDTTNGTGGGAVANGVQQIIYPEPILAVRNPSHRVESSSANFDAGVYLHIHYRFVRLTDAELGFALARRGR